MHIRFESTSLVSGRAEPEDDIIDRRDRYYVYLKPHGADDAALRAAHEVSRRPAGLHPDAAALGAGDAGASCAASPHLQRVIAGLVPATPIMGHGGAI